MNTPSRGRKYASYLKLMEQNALELLELRRRDEVGMTNNPIIAHTINSSTIP